MISTAVSLKERAAAVSRSIDRLDAQRDILISQKAEALIEIQNSTHYLDHKDEVLEFLNHVQTESQKATKGMYEDLLSSLITEVLPNKHDRVVFSTSIKNNKMALDIDIKSKSKQKLLNVKKDKGGSIQNIVAMGLRFITVSRSRNRKIILLDEADQSLNTKQIPRFAKIIKQLSEQLNIQVIYISHHSPDAFAGCAKVINLEDRNGVITVTSDNSSDFDDDDVGIRYARLTNFKQHTNTLINFSKNVTVITGEVDIGKSSVIEAISVVMNNEGRDGLIKDETPMAAIELGIEEGRCIKFEYDASGSSRTRYFLFEENSDKPTKTSTDGINVPKWLDDYLATPKLGNFDIHISRQMSSNFILDESFSAQKRAEILSLENESEQIQKMIALHGETTLFHKRNVVAMNKRLNQVKNDLDKLGILNGAIDALNKAQASISKADSKAEELAEITRIGKVLGVAKTKVNTLIAIREVTQVCDLPPLSEVANLAAIISDTERLSNSVACLSAVRQISAIEMSPLKELAKITEMGKKLNSAKRKVAILKPIAGIKPIEDFSITDCTDFKIVPRLEAQIKLVNVLRPVSDIKNISIGQITDLMDLSLTTSKVELSLRNVTDLSKQAVQAAQDESLISKEIEDFEATIGHKCPLCASHIEKDCRHG